MIGLVEVPILYFNLILLVGGKLLRQARQSPAHLVIETIFDVATSRYFIGNQAPQCPIRFTALIAQQKVV